MKHMTLKVKTKDGHSMEGVVKGFAPKILELR